MHLFHGYYYAAPTTFIKKGKLDTITNTLSFENTSNKFVTAFRVEVQDSFIFERIIITTNLGVNYNWNSNNFNNHIHYSYLTINKINHTLQLCPNPGLKKIIEFSIFPYVWKKALLLFIVLFCIIVILCEAYFRKVYSNISAADTIFVIILFNLFISFFCTTSWNNLSFILFSLFILVSGIFVENINRAFTGVNLILLCYAILRLVILSATSNTNFNAIKSEFELYLPLLELPILLMLFPFDAKRKFIFVNTFLFFLFFVFSFNLFSVIYNFIVFGYIDLFRYLVEIKTYSNYVTFFPHSYIHPTYASSLFILGITFIFFYKKLQIISTKIIYLFFIIVSIVVFIYGARIILVLFLFILASNYIINTAEKNIWIKQLLLFIICLLLISLYVLYMDPFRRQLWDISLYSIQNNYFSGVGLNETAKIFSSSTINKLLAYSETIPFEKSHNQFLLDWMELGIIRGSLLLLFFVVLLYNSIKRNYYLLFQLLCIFVMLLFVEDVFERSRGILIFSIFCCSFSEPIK